MATTDIAFTPNVKAIQQRRGSRAAYARFEENGGFRDRVTPDLAAFLAERDGLLIATASADGRPYAQYRGGPPGFLRALDDRTLAFADFRGNRQYITLGNLGENDRAFLFLIDHATRRRIKLWGRARVVDDDPALLERLADPAYDGRPEQAIVFTLEAWDENCPRHIPQRLLAAEVEAVVEDLRAQVARLAEENRVLRERRRGR